jgi:hypothetical protein
MNRILLSVTEFVVPVTFALDAAAPYAAVVISASNPNLNLPEIVSKRGAIRNTFDREVLLALIPLV